LGVDVGHDVDEVEHVGVLVRDLKGNLLNVGVLDDSVRVCQFLQGLLSASGYVVEVILVFLNFVLVVARTKFGLIHEFLYLILLLLQLDAFTGFVKVADHYCQEEVPHDNLTYDYNYNELNEKLVGCPTNCCVHYGVPVVSCEHLKGGNDGDKE